MQGAHPVILATRPAGPRGLLIEVDGGDPAAVASAVRRVAAERGIELEDVVPGACTVLVTVRDPSGWADLATLVDAIAHLPAEAPAPAPAVVMDVRYDGADLAWVAEHTGLRVSEVIALHCGAEYRARFTGFAPGFAYLTGVPDVLRVPRRPAPRTVVPAGSVAIADGYSAVYPRRSPGGWQLLGTTAAVLWDHRRPRPALIVAGTVVRFRVSGAAGR